MTGNRANSVLLVHLTFLTNPLNFDENVKNFTYFMSLKSTIEIIKRFAASLNSEIGVNGSLTRIEFKPHD